MKPDTTALSKPDPEQTAKICSMNLAKVAAGFDWRWKGYVAHDVGGQKNAILRLSRKRPL